MALERACDSKTSAGIASINSVSGDYGPSKADPVGSLEDPSARIFTRTESDDSLDSSRKVGLADSFEQLGSASELSSDEVSTSSFSHFDSYDNFALQKYNATLEQYINKSGGRAGLKQSYDALCNMERQAGQREPMLGHLRMAIGYLLGDYRGKSNEWGTTNPREDYQNFVHHLRRASEEQSKQGSDHYPKAQQLIGQFASVRWFGTDIYSYVEKSVEHTTQAYDEHSSSSEELPELTESSFSEVSRKLANKIKHAPDHVKKSFAALQKQKFEGITGLKDFSGTENTPFVRCEQVYTDAEGKERSVKYHRHSRPTVGGSTTQWGAGIVPRIGYVFINRISRLLGSLTGSKEIRPSCLVRGSGETIAPDYERAIRAAEAKGEGVFYVVHQRSDAGALEIEGESTQAIKDLQDRHKNFHVLQQTVEGDLFERKGALSGKKSKLELKNALVASFMPGGLNSLPKCLQNDPVYVGIVLPQLFDQVAEIFFDGKDDLTLEEWQSFILLFYVFQKIELKARLSEQGYPIAHYVTPCKDFLDRGGNMAMVEDLVHYYMAGGPSLMDLRRTMMITQGTPILVKKKEALMYRLEPGFRVADRLAALTPEKKKQLQECTFGGWKVQQVVHPGEKPQQGKWG